VQTFGTGKLPDEKIERSLEDLVDLRPAAIVEAFGLRALPERHGGEFYRTLAAYGHFGRTDLEVPWEREDLVAGLGRPAGRAR
jgi:S-adenosylmethionine synthetase